MENELTLFDNEIAGTDEEKFTTRQLAEQLNMDGKPCAYTRIFVTEKGLVWLAKFVDNSENKI